MPPTSTSSSSSFAPPLPLSSNSPPLSSFVFSLKTPFPPQSLPTWRPLSVAQNVGVSTHHPRKNKNTNTKKSGRGRKDGDVGGPSEEEDLVKFLLSKSDGDDKKKQQPLVATLNKYVKVIRTEHCFLLFEQLGRKDNWLQCLEVFRWMQKQRWYVADNGIYSKLISVMGKQGQIRMAMWLFTEMRSSGCRPDTSVYNSLITAHLHSRDKVKALSKAFGYFEKMKGIERCQPNVVTYNILLRAYAQAGDSMQVEALFKDLEAGVASPDIYTYNGVMGAYGKNGSIREMESVLLRMKSGQCKPNVITFNLLIDSYGKRQAFDKMEQVFLSLIRSKEKPTLPTFNSMIINYGKARLRDKAESIFSKMKQMGYTPSYITYESLITTYGYCDCVSRAREIFDEMMDAKKDAHVSTLNSMLDAYCTNGLPNEADQLMEEFSSGNKGLVPNSSTYKLLYKAYNKANAKQLVEKLVSAMDERGIVPNKKFFYEALDDFSRSSRTSTRSSNNANSRTSTRSSNDANSRTSTRSSNDANSRTSMRTNSSLHTSSSQERASAVATRLRTSASSNPPLPP